jgi:hypothetical protein
MCETASVCGDRWDGHTGVGESGVGTVRVFGDRWGGDTRLVGGEWVHTVFAAPHSSLARGEDMSSCCRLMW